MKIHPLDYGYFCVSVICILKTGASSCSITRFASPDARKNFAVLWNITDDDQLRINMNIFAFGIGNLGGPDLFIVLLIVLILFGAKKLPDLARSLGQSMNEFRKAREDIDRELHNAGARPSEAATLPVRAATGKVSEPDR
jgi:sec-independent protein translocase protein TatA